MKLLIILTLIIFAQVSLADNNEFTCKDGQNSMELISQSGWGNAAITLNVPNSSQEPAEEFQDFLAVIGEGNNLNQRTLFFNYLEGFELENCDVQSSSGAVTSFHCDFSKKNKGYLEVVFPGDGGGIQNLVLKGKSTSGIFEVILSMDYKRSDEVSKKINFQFNTFTSCQLL